jgi:hypothetical protein
MSGQLFKGKAAAAINDVMRQYICSLFCLWKLVKAADVSSAGGFKTSTINALRNVVDENGNGFFPSSTTVNQSRALLTIMAWKSLAITTKIQSMVRCTT